MRRFISSLAGRIFSQAVIASLLVPTLALAFVNRSEANSQVQFQPSWAVTQFDVHNGLDPAYGEAAAAAINTELARTSKYNMIPPTVVASQIKTLGLTSPLQGSENLLRVGQELRASTIVSGDVIAQQIKSVGGGRQAKVAMRAVAYDVASGLPINGSAVVGTSTTRSGSDVTDDVLIRDAIRAGANAAIREFQQHQLPGATVLNTLTDRCYINQGTRAGFSAGQEVVITRGREEVATGHIADLEPDEASVIIERSFLGVAPGDHIRAIYPVPTVSFDNPFTKTGAPNLIRSHNAIGNNAGLISLLVVVGLVGVLLGNGGNTQNVLNSVTAQATLITGIPGVLVSWSPNAYAKGNSQIAAWQVWRSDVFDAPVDVTQGNVRSVVDQYFASGIDTQYTTWSNFNGVIGGTGNVCNTDNNATAPANLPSINLGQSYIYQVELVYELSSLDLPIVTTSSSTAGGSTSGVTTSTSSTSGTTASGTGTTTTTGTTTGGTTGTTTSGTTSSTSSTSGTTGSTSSTSGGTEYCYFISPRQSSGQATPLAPPVLLTPGSSAIAAGTQTTFSFTGSSRLQAQEIQYVIQFSNSASFTPGSGTYTYPHVITSFATGGANGATVTLPQPLVLFGTNGLLPSAIADAATIFWRVGARAAGDNPGPVPDPLTQQRYIFSLEPGYFSEAQSTPSNPSSKVKVKVKHSHQIGTVTPANH